MPNDPAITGLHHIALVSQGLERTSDFYGRILGLPPLGSGSAPSAGSGGADQLMPVGAQFFGDGGEQGRLIVILNQPGAARGAPGLGGTHHFAFAVADREILLQWKRRLLDEGYPVNGILDRHYFQSIYTQDPDGTIVELATMGPGWSIDEAPDTLGETHRPPPPEMLNTNRNRAAVAAENWPEPISAITPTMRIHGLHHVTAIGADIERIHGFVGEALGMRRVKRTNNFDDAASFHWYWGVGDGAPGTLVTYFERRPERERPARMGSGQVAHYGMAADPGKFESLADKLASRRVPVSESQEFGPGTARFRAFATRDPDGQAVVLTSGVME